MQSNKTTASLLQPDLFPDFRTASFSPPKHSRDLCIPQRKWEFLCHTLYLGKYPFLLGPKGCGDGIGRCYGNGLFRFRYGAGI